MGTLALDVTDPEGNQLELVCYDASVERVVPENVDLPLGPT
jgi:hypothetical protein